MEGDNDRSLEGVGEGDLGIVTMQIAPNVFDQPRLCVGRGYQSPTWRRSRLPQSLDGLLSICEQIDKWTGLRTNASRHWMDYYIRTIRSGRLRMI